MGKSSLDKAADAVKRAVDDTRDAVREGAHRGAADSERARREALHDEMKPSEKARSVLNEAKHRTQAELDAAKRKTRDNI